MDLSPCEEVHAFIARKHLVDAGACYQVAFLAGQLLARQGLKVRIVHGNPKYSGQARARRIGHAWNEVLSSVGKREHAVVVEFSRPSLMVLPLDFYYGVGHITVTRKYTFVEAQVLLDRHESFGPWDPCFSQLLFNREPRSQAS